MADADLEAILARIPNGGAASTTPNLQCCCGRTECSFLKHNCSALDDLEQEVRTAASLGQVCFCFSTFFVILQPIFPLVVPEMSICSLAAHPRTYNLCLAVDIRWAFY